MADINLGVGGANSAVAGGYEIENSLKLESDNAEYLYYTSSTQTDYKRMAFSLWIKRTELSTSQRIAEFGNGTSNTSNLRIGFDTSDRLFCYGNSIIFRQTNQVFRDTSAWYHLFFQFDTTQSTANDRIKIWVNGSMIAHTDFGVINNPGSGAAMGFNNGLQQSIGAQREDGPVGYFNGYMAQVYGSGGTPPSVTDFGEVDENTGIWKPIDISELTPPDTQGFNLDFSDSSNLGNDISSRNNNFTLQNITSADQATDTPTNNFAIGNILTGKDGFFVITEGATKAVLSTAGPGNNIGGVSLVSTLAPSSGKWYFEAQNTNSGDAYLFLGVADTASIGYTEGYVLGGQNGTTPSIAWRGGGAYDGSAKVYSDNSAIGSSVNWETEVVGVALDLDNGKIYFHKSGTYINSGDPVSGTDNGGQYDLPTAVDGQWYLGVSAYNLATWLINFGGFTTMPISTPASDANGYGTFEYAPPSGYYALCTKNLARFG
jgi:hypothetical protein